MPIIYHKDINQHTELGIWKITEQEEDLYKILQLSEDEKAFYKTLNHGTRSIHWLSSRVLLRTMLNTDEYIDLKQDKNNKPYLVNFPFNVSISHSYEMAAVLLSKEKKVGVDLEKFSDKIVRVASRFLSQNELDFLDKQNYINHLYVCWSAKESLFKLYGNGGLSFSNHIHLFPFDYSTFGTLKARVRKNDYEQFFEVSYFLVEGYVVAWVLE